MLPFYFVRTQEKCEIALLDMFNNLRVNKYTDESRTTFTKTVRVPITIHQSKDFANWVSSNSNPTRPMPLPIAGLKYLRKEQNSSNRTQATYARAIFSKASEQWIRDIQPTPYRLYYELEVLTDNMSDWHQLNENITPYFNTFRTLRIKEFDFAPDIECKIPVYLSAVDDVYDPEEVELNSGKHQFLRSKYALRLDVDWYRPFEIPQMIMYAQMNLKVEDIIHMQQVFVYPDQLAEQEKKQWESVSDSTREGYSILKTLAGTLVQEGTLGSTTTTWKEITAPDAIRPQEVPSFQLLHLDFDTDTPQAYDTSGMGRDFLVLNDAERTFIPDFPPGAGQQTDDGYELDPAVSWNKILDWFGTENGEHASPFTWSIIVQFTEEPVPDTIFQILANEETIAPDGTTIPEGEVYFEWGLIDQKLCFRLKTYGDNALFYTFTTKSKLPLNSTDIYKFVFANYDKGHSGMFAYSVNSGPMQALGTERDAYDGTDNSCSQI